MSNKVSGLEEYYIMCEKKFRNEEQTLKDDKQLWGIIQEYVKLLKRIVNQAEGYEMYAHAELRDLMFAKYGVLFTFLSEEKTYIIDYLDNLLITEESITRYEMCEWYIAHTFESMNARNSENRWSMESIFNYSYEEAYNFWGEVWHTTNVKYPKLIDRLKKRVQSGQIIY